MHFEISAAPLKDRFGDDFMVVALPQEYIPTDKDRNEWKQFFRENFDFPVVIAYWEIDNRKKWTLEGRPILVRELEELGIDDLPWQRILVESSRRPPISYDRLPPSDLM